MSKTSKKNGEVHLPLATLSKQHESTQDKLADLIPELAWLEANRPKTRGDCEGHEGPCPFFSCRHHLGLDVDQRGGLNLHFTSLTEDRPTCSLDMIGDRTAYSINEVAHLASVSREKVKVIEEAAGRRIRNGTRKEYRQLREIARLLEDKGKE